MSSGHPSSNRFPVLHKKLSLVIKGNSTDVVICSYDDHFLVMVTQIGTMGTILHARKEEGVSIDPTFNVSVIFGKRDEPMLEACARQLIEKISSSGSSKPLVLSLGLKDHSVVPSKPYIENIFKIEQYKKIIEDDYYPFMQETLKGIVSAVTENRLW